MKIWKVYDQERGDLVIEKDRDTPDTKQRLTKHTLNFTHSQHKVKP